MNATDVSRLQTLQRGERSRSVKPGAATTCRLILGTDRAGPAAQSVPRSLRRKCALVPDLSRDRSCRFSGTIRHENRRSPRRIEMSDAERAGRTGLLGFFVVALTG